MRDLYSDTKTALALSPAEQAVPTTGAAIDLVGSRRVVVVLVTGEILGMGNFGAKLQESDTLISGDFADVPSGLVDSDAPATLEADSTYRLGYRGHKRYIRLSLTKASGTNITAGAVAVMSDLKNRPAG